MKLSEVVNQNETLENLRKETIDLYKHLIETGSKITPMNIKKCKKERIKCEEEVKKVFEEEGFDTNFEKNKYIFKKGSLTIEFYYDGEDEMIIFQMKIMPNNRYFAIHLRPNAKDDNMLYWKNNISLDGKHLYTENYIELINKCSNTKELDKAKIQLKENIDHYENTINNYDSIVYIYSLYKDDVEFDTFKELLENRILEQL
ncbi:hypothetical protein UMC2_35271 [[Clostridium] sordellii]|uniref:hypothetical protein n=1 Tax=Paraclostridium sordellii TaxID=1505 RepID=UPI0005441DF8|nr:hypothetical protein [Paeniclostridium sordellii]CEK34316.1 hypothetical protein UMC2_35271 [[Clostridium] sordellii] [Paeniclostridium sordellii]